MSDLLIPPAYLGPQGLPLAWASEETGVLRAAIMAYYDQVLGKGEMTVEQLLFLRAYLVHVINAPCWLEKNPHADLKIALNIGDLRRRAAKMTTVKEVTAFLDSAWETADLDLL